MARLLLCLLVVVGSVACENDARDDDAAARLHGRAQALDASLADALERSARLERRLERERHRRVVLRDELRRTRGVDLWTGGPTIAGAFLPLPRLGTFSWRCHDGRRFRIDFEAGGASVRVGYDTPDAQRSRTLHSNGSMHAVLDAGETVTWTITHRHKPGLIRARVEVTTATSKRGNCLLPLVRLDETGDLYD